ncbi:MAG TPA: GNAT family N-acetyltransferase [Actinospica sp.]|nr:GNAT family N-acetyltransferase [Actinospica sp.]
MNDFSQRPLTDADASAYADLTHVMSRADGSSHRADEAGFRFHLNHPLRANGFEDFQGVFDGDRLVAMAWLQRAGTADTAHWMQADGGVHPDYRGRGLGTSLLRWQADLAPRIHEHYFPGRPLELTARVADTNTAARDLFAHEGFTPVRWSVSMRRPAEAPEPEAELPEGLVLEPYTPAVARELRLAHNEIFLDHFRGSPWPEDAWLAWIAQDKIRHDLSFLLRDPESDGTIAGFVISSHSIAEDIAPDARELHLNIVGTRRPYRGRGVASGLITQVVRAARKHGYPTQSLGVDAENSTGAISVYEHSGFEAVRRYVLYNKVYGV